MASSFVEADLSRIDDINIFNVRIVSLRRKFLHSLLILFQVYVPQFTTFLGRSFLGLSRLLFSGSTDLDLAFVLVVGMIENTIWQPWVFQILNHFVVLNPHIPFIYTFILFTLGIWFNIIWVFQNALTPYIWILYWRLSHLLSVHHLHVTIINGVLVISEIDFLLNIVFVIIWCVAATNKYTSNIFPILLLLCPLLYLNTHYTICIICTEFLVARKFSLLNFILNVFVWLIYDTLIFAT